MPTKDSGGFELEMKLVNGGTISYAQLSRIFSGTFSLNLTREEKLDPKNIKKVIFNPPATIVIFKDDTKTVVKSHNEDFDPEKGVLMALARHIWDSRADFNRFMEKWTVEGNDKK